MKFIFAIDDKVVRFDLRCEQADLWQHGDKTDRKISTTVIAKSRDFTHHLFTIDQQPFELFCHRHEDETWDVYLHGTAYRCKRLTGNSNGADGRHTKGHASDKRALVRSVIPGKIVETMVKVGDFVEFNQPLLVIEAMKMENDVCAPMAGKIKRLHVEENMSVEMNALLVEIEKEA